MARTYDGIDDALAAWIAAQHVFFVATAPSGSEGHVNVSPKGLDSLRVFDPHTVAYLDLTGSGAETIAHVRENGRITLMFCAFEGPPKIVRLHGRGAVHLPGSAGFGALAGRFPDIPGTRSIIQVDVARVSTSCGYAVPLMEHVDDRPTLIEWAERKGDAGLAAYHAEKNATSLDGLPALAP